MSELLAKKVLRPVYASISEDGLKRKLRRMLPSVIYKKYAKDVPEYSEGFVFELAMDCGVYKYEVYDHGNDVLVNFFTPSTFPFQFTLPKPKTDAV